MGSIKIEGPIEKGFERVLTKDALAFLSKLHVQFNPKRLALLKARAERQKKLDAGELPDFLAETRSVRESKTWSGPKIPADLEDRRVEITGPVDRKMVINALNSGANVFMADFEDSSSPTWRQMIGGQVNMMDAVRRTISFEQKGKKYKLKPDKELATLMVRPRGWHLDEAHLTVDGKPMSGSLVDFGLFFFHNAQELIKRKSGPYFYLPKLEGHLEARLWNDVFVTAQKAIGIPVGTIRATVLIETILAAFEMDEIIHELKLHSAGLNCGRWDYIFSFIKKLKSLPDMVLPNRADVGMTRPFMDAYVRLLIQTCHKRKVHAMGGMAAQIPIRDDPKKNEAALAKVARDKAREVNAGHDGTWVAHPGLIPIARKEFDRVLKNGKKNQLGVHPVYKSPITAKDLLNIGKGGERTMEGFLVNIDVGLRYLEAWLRGIGCVPLHNMMEDAATAEISRSQIWQWLRHKAPLDDTKEIVTPQLVTNSLEKIMGDIKKELGPAEYKKSRFDLAAKIYAKLMLDKELHEFLTLDAYPHIITKTSSSKL